MKLISATDLAIAMAIKAKTLNFDVRKARTGGFYIVIADQFGMIEVANNWVDCDARIDAITAAIS